MRFDRGAPWASLELHDDDLLPMVALQAADKELAVEGFAPCAGCTRPTSRPSPPAEPSRTVR